MSDQTGIQTSAGSDTPVTREECDAAFRALGNFIGNPSSFLARRFRTAMYSLVDDETPPVHGEPALVIDEEAHLTDAEFREVVGGQEFGTSRRRVVLAHLVRGCDACRQVAKNAEWDSFRPADSLSQALADWLRVARGIQELSDFMPAHGWTLARLTEAFDGRDFARAYVEAARYPEANRGSLESLHEADEDLLALAKAGIGNFNVFRALANAYAADLSSNIIEACMAGKAADDLLTEAAIDDTDQAYEIRAMVLEINAKQIVAEKCEMALERFRTAENILTDMQIPGRWLESALRTSAVLMEAGRSEDAAVLLREAREKLSPDVSKFLLHQLFHFLTYTESVAGRYEVALEILRGLEYASMPASIRDRMPFELLHGLSFFHCVARLMPILEKNTRHIGVECSLADFVELWGDLSSEVHSSEDPMTRTRELSEALLNVSLRDMVGQCPRLAADELSVEKRILQLKTARELPLVNRVQLEALLTRMELLLTSTNVLDSMILLGYVLVLRSMRCLGLVILHMMSLVESKQQRVSCITSFIESMREVLREGHEDHYFSGLLKSFEEAQSSASAH